MGLSVDDFGTGFSGLSRLVSLPVTEIKIDKSFVDRCLTEKRILALLEAITSIGQSLNLTVVAEGVETKEQFEMLRKIHCRVIQGYFFSRPLPAEEIPGWMSSVLPLKIWQIPLARTRGFSFNVTLSLKYCDFSYDSGRFLP